MGNSRIIPKNYTIPAGHEKPIIASIESIAPRLSLRGWRGEGTTKHPGSKDSEIFREISKRADQSVDSTSLRIPTHLSEQGGA